MKPSLSLFVLCFAAGALAQPPDCQIQATFTAAGRSSPIPALSASSGTPCVVWRLTYHATGFSGLSIEIDGAPDTGGAAGSWTVLPSSVITEGSNPSTSTSEQTIAAKVYHPWVSIDVTSVTGTGTIQARLMGWRNASQQGAVPAGTNIVGKVGIDQTTPGTSNGVQLNAALPAGTNNIGKVGIDQTTPGTTNGVQVNAALPAGTNNIGRVVPIAGSAAGEQAIDPCQDASLTRTPFSISQTANTRIITGTAAKKTYLCFWNIGPTADAENVALVEGTGSICATSTIALGGTPAATAANGYQFPANGGIVIGNGGFSVAVTTVVADDVCAFQSGSGRVPGGGFYVQK